MLAPAAVCMQLVCGEKGTAALGNKLKQLLETEEYAPAGGDYADVVYDMEMVQQQPKQAAATLGPASGKGRRAVETAEQHSQPASKRTKKK